MEKKKFKVPHTYVIIMMIIILVTVATWIVPAGVYDRYVDEATGRTLVDVDSFHNVDQTPVGFFAMFCAIPKAFKEAIAIMAFIFMIGGAFNIIRGTGAIEAGLGASIGTLRKNEKLVIPALVFIFSVAGFTLGSAEELIVFVPVVIMLARSLGYDDIVGIAIVSTGACCGFAGGMMNPFTVGIAQGIAELPMYSGALFRTIVYFFLYAITVWYITRYAKKVKADPRNSVLWEEGKELARGDFDGGDKEWVFTGRHKLVLVFVAIMLGVMAYGIAVNGWYTTELGAIFLIIGIGAGIIGGVGFSKQAEFFIEGAKDICSGALVIGLARTILVIMTEGQIMDAIVHGLAGLVDGLPTSIAAVGLFIVSSFINFFIPSGSGQAATTVPILVPLADVLGMTRQTAVLCFQYGDAFSNQIVPTSGALLGVLAMAGVPYDKWLKYNWKIVLYWSIVGAVAVFVAATINLGPF